MSNTALQPSPTPSATAPQVFARPDVPTPFLTGLIVRQFGQKLIDRAVKTPYFHLEDYMLRFWLVKPKSKQGVTLRGPFKGLRDLGIRVHCIRRSDRDAALHDHPWWNVSLILKGCYWEVLPMEGKRPDQLPKGAVLITNPDHEPAYALFRPQGSFIVRGPKTRHRLVVNLDDLDGEQGVWTLFMTFGKGGDWGFYEPEQGNNRKLNWRVWWQYIGVSKDGGDPGPGAVVKARPNDKEGVV